MSSLKFDWRGVAWLLGMAALLVVVWRFHGSTVRRVERMRDIPEWSVDSATPDSHSQTGYAGGVRRLLVQGANDASYQWIEQTQQMLATGDWRVRHVSHENAPAGRVVHAASPYRWWLGLVAILHHATAGGSIGRSVEFAALWANPLLHLVVIFATACFVGARWNLLSGGLVGIGLAGLFPLAGEFWPGASDDYVLVILCALWSQLLMLAGAHSPRPVRWFFISGLLGGAGLWIAPARMLPLIVGTALGGLIAGRMKSKTPAGAGSSMPAATWHAWALGGAVVCVAGYLFEYFPSHLAVRLEAINPLIALAWLGLGELLAGAGSRVTGEVTGRNRWSIARAAAGAAAVIAVISIYALKHEQAFFAVDPYSFRLSQVVPVEADRWFAWLRRDGLTVPLLTTLMPLVTLTVAMAMLSRRTLDQHQRVWLALAIGPAVVACGFSMHTLRWWPIFDATLLTVLVALSGSGATRRAVKIIAIAVAVVAFIPSYALLATRGNDAGTDSLGEADVQGLVERDLAQWLVTRAGSRPTVLLAAPSVTTRLCYYGGFNGIGTLNWENRDGLATTIRMVAATSPEEAQALVTQRGVTHVVLPSWDASLEEYARMGAASADNTFLAALQRWNLPPWLRPVPYKIPKSPGFENLHVAVFEVVDDQDDALSISRLAEYFLEIGQPDLSAALQSGLERFPRSVMALTALGQVQLARADHAGAERTLATLQPLLSRADRGLPWERRVSLALLLAQARRPELAQAQLQRCVAEATEARLRSLTTGTLLRLQLTMKTYSLEFAEPPLRDLAIQLMPPELRSRL